MYYYYYFCKRAVKIKAKQKLNDTTFFFNRGIKKHTNLVSPLGIHATKWEKQTNKSKNKNKFQDVYPCGGNKQDQGRDTVLK